MTKLGFTASGAASIAASVPIMHLLGGRQRDPQKKKIVDVSTMVLFLIGWVLLAVGLSKAPSGADVDDAWKNRQIGLVVAGVVLVVGGVAAVKYRSKASIPFSVGGSAFVAGWGLLTAAIVYSDPDYKDMGSDEKAGRVIQSLTGALTVMSGAALIGMSGQVRAGAPTTTSVPLTPATMEVASVATFLMGWLNVVSVSALQ